MPTYIAFLRAINIGKRKFAKEAIVAACEAAGCTDVETYINTGNVRVTTPLRSRAKVEAALEEAFADEAGFEVPTVVLTPKELPAVAAYAEKVGRGHDGLHYVSLLKDDAHRGCGEEARRRRQGRGAGRRGRPGRAPPARRGLPLGQADQRNRREAPRQSPPTATST